MRRSLALALLGPLVLAGFVAWIRRDGAEPALAPSSGRDTSDVAANDADALDGATILSTSREPAESAPLPDEPRRDPAPPADEGEVKRWERECAGLSAFEPRERARQLQQRVTH